MANDTIQNLRWIIATVQSSDSFDKEQKDKIVNILESTIADIIAER